MSGFNRDDIKSFMRKVYASQEISDTSTEIDNKQKLLNECGCEDLENPSLYEDYGSSPSEGMHHHVGSFTPSELYSHFDIDQDGKVSIEDYADHVAYHARHPEILEPYERKKSEAMKTARCPESYKRAGDIMIQVPDDVIEMIKPMMQQLGVGCPHSFAQALTDVLGSAMDKEVIKPFSVE